MGLEKAERFFFKKTMVMIIIAAFSKFVTKPAATEAPTVRFKLPGSLW
jgi:hypothetical protein